MDNHKYLQKSVLEIGNKIIAGGQMGLSLVEGPCAACKASGGRAVQGVGAN